MGSGIMDRIPIPYSHQSHPCEGRRVDGQVCQQVVADTSDHCEAGHPNKVRTNVIALVDTGLDGAPEDFSVEDFAPPADRPDQSNPLVSQYWDDGLDNTCAHAVENDRDRCAAGHPNKVRTPAVVRASAGHDKASGDFSVEDLAPLTDGDVQNSWGRNGCPWLVLVPSGNPEPDSEADMWTEVSAARSCTTIRRTGVVAKTDTFSVT